MFLQKMNQHCRIPDELAAKAIDKPWKETAAHLGPHRHTPLRQALEFKTSAALLLLSSASLVWAWQRLRQHGDAGILLELAEAVFCHQVAEAYLKPVEQYRFIPMTQNAPFVEGAVLSYLWVFFRQHYQRPGKWPQYPPVIATAQLVYLTQYIMPKRDKRYEDWTTAALQRLASVAGLPDPRTEALPPGTDEAIRDAEARRVLGTPLAPLALDPEAPFDAAANRAEIAEILAGMDWSRNRFLRSPDELRAQGFEGEPYALEP